ncbi:phospholipase A1-IIgamma-like [Pistacia vera]|uniref:phospholipase A1-IIgamma-like n=1 Tax=Pistacia vera TaxID=55513 RepID=UPI0012630A61|nr:phospholipase A1-IIgamma-like [Pistacia vera]
MASYKPVTTHDALHAGVYLNNKKQTLFPFIRHPTVHQGFYSIYTTPKSASKKTSARDQVFEEVRKLVNEYQNEEVSITVTGHSLGAALATMNAVDMVSNGYNMPISNPNKEFLVTAFAFASPKVGDVSFQTEFNNHMTKAKLRLLRIENNQDLVTRLPLGNFVAVGYEIPISTTNASADEGGKLSKAHS